MKSKRYALSALAVKQKQKPGRYSDNANNLYLQITQTGVKSWIFRYSIAGKRKEMGLGPYPTITLEEARTKAATLYKQIRENPSYCPITAREKELRAERLKQQKEVTFAWCAEKYISVKRSEWKNPKHGQQWENTITTYANPILGNYPIQDIDTALIMQVLQPIWTEKNETASRLRGRLEKILAWATVQGYRPADNPAQWKNHLESLLPKSGKIQKRQHHKALPYKEISNFIQELRKHESMSAYALEFLILTAARTNEVINALWEEIDFASKTWTIPKDRMKAGREHTVPLSNRAMQIISKMHDLKTSNYIFQSTRPSKGLSNAAMDKLLQVTMGYDCTVHGFRSTFRDWGAEETNYPNEILEMALAHTIKNKAEAAYRRGDLLKKRAQLMENWLQHIEKQPSGKVIPIKATIAGK